MLFVVNKEKVMCYLIAFSTVIILIGMAVFWLPGENAVETAARIREVPVYSVDTEENKVALTMNCAWNADDIDSILETLQNENCKITFFMVGDWIEKNEEAAKKIAQAGHELANHSNTHPHVNNLNLEKNEEEIKQCSDKIKKITGKESIFYRGPYGEYNNTVIRAAKQQNHITIQWSIDSLDYTGLSEQEMIARIEPSLKKGSIILMHNGTKNTANSLPAIINMIKEKGFEIVPVSELVYQENYTIDANGVQHQE